MFSESAESALSEAPSLAAPAGPRAALVAPEASPGPAMVPYCSSAALGATRRVLPAAVQALCRVGLRARLAGLSLVVLTAEAAPERRPRGAFIDLRD